MFWSRWTPFSNPVWHQLTDLQGEVNRLFDQWGDRGRQFLGLAGYPALNLWEDEDALTLETELPGLEMKDVEIYVTGQNQLTIKGERKANVPEKGLWHRQERGFGKFSRSLTLPFNVDADKVDARFENGVLLVKLPKHESARPRKIAVKGE